MNQDLVQLDIKGETAIITLFHKSNKNVFSYALWDRLHQQITAVEQNEAVKFIVITGYEQVFCLGMPIKVASNISIDDIARAIEYLQKVNLAIINSSKIFIAVVNGYAFGPGFELALACDLILASSKASCSLPQASRGMITDAGGLSLLQWKGISQFVVKEILFSGKKYSADELKQFGIVSDCLEHSQLMDLAQGYIRNLSQNSYLSLMAYKKLINSEQALVALKQSLALEKTNQLALIQQLINQKKFVVDSTLTHSF